MKTLTFIRHAESVSNAGGVTMPHEAIPLSDLGHLQAQKLAALRSVPPVAVLVSSMFVRIRPLHPFVTAFPWFRRCIRTWMSFQ